MSTGLKFLPAPACALSIGLVLALLCPSAEASPEIDSVLSEVHIGGPPIFGSARGVQRRPAVAFDGANYLVLWEEDREHPGVDIYGARVTPSGTVIDSIGIIVSIGEDTHGSPAVAFDGTNYFVVWMERREGDLDIYGARVGTTGAVLDPGGIPISTAAGDQLSPDITFDGTNYLVVWHDRTDSGDIYAARVDTTGTVLDPGGIPISIAEESQDFPAVAFDGTNYLIVWCDDRGGGRDIYGTRLTPAGEVLDTAGVAITSTEEDETCPAVTFGGSNYMVVWSFGSVFSDSAEVVGTRVTPAGELLDPVVVIASTGVGGDTPGISFDGTNYLVTWGDFRDSTWAVYAARIDSSALVLDPLGFGVRILEDRTLALWARPAVAFDGTNSLVVWEDVVDIMAGRVSAAGVVIDNDGFAVSTTGNTQRFPAASFDGKDHLVAWVDERGGLSFIYGARVNSAGELIDPSPIAISTRGVVNAGAGPSLAFGGANHLAVWGELGGLESQLDIHGARVSNSGAVLDTGGIVISAEEGQQHGPVVGFDGTNYLVAWWERSLSGETDIRAARLDTSGAVLDSPSIILSSGEGTQLFRPALAFGGTNYLVAWTDREGDRSDVYAARVDRSGTLLDPMGILISTEESAARSPAVAFDGMNYMVVWWDDRNVDPGIYGARVDPTGAVLDPGGIRVAAVRSTRPDIAFDGSVYIVVWGDNRDDDGDIYGARVDTSGVVLDPDGVAISTMESSQTLPAIVPGGAGNTLVSYASFMEVYDSHHIWANAFRLPVPDKIPPGLTIGILQNPYLTQHLDLYLVGSEPLDSASVTLEGGEIDLPLRLVDPKENVWTSDYLLAAPAGSLALKGCAADTSGNDTCVTVSFSATHIDAVHGGEVKSIDSQLTLRIGENILERDAWILVIPTEREGTYRISPPDLVLLGDATLEIRLSAENLGNAGPSSFLIERDGEGPLGSFVNAKRRTVSASISKLGTFRLVEGAPGSSRLTDRGYLQVPQNAPNPFNPSTSIRFEIRDRQHVSINIYEPSGRKVAGLVDRPFDSGFHTVEWNGQSSSGEEVPSGVYFARVKTAHQDRAVKVLLVR